MRGRKRERESMKGSMRAPARRHGRRAPRSALTGPALQNPNGRVARFEFDARGAVELMQSLLPEEMRGVQVGFQTVPTGTGQSEFPMFYSVDRASQTIVLYRMPLQRAKGLHVDDDEHRRYFIEHCLYRAVCEYLGREPWDLLPGRFDHF